MRILVVDDDSSLREALAAVVADAAGVEPRTFCDGYLVLEDLAASESDSSRILAFIDVEMPVLDGMSLVRQLKSRYPHAVVVMMSANRKYRESAYLAGADYFLHKPFELDEMIGLIDRFGRENVRKHCPVELETASFAA
ncbi:MAG: response regulator [Chloroflexota bacterium]|nr:response regulator [Chloroflexota bacterium]